MAICITPTDDLQPNQPIHCPRCGWKGHVSEAKVIPSSVVQCPACTGPCCEGHLPEKPKT